MNEPGRDQIVVADAAAAAVAANDESQDDGSPPPYLRLLVDCWEQILDFLSLEDIFTLGQTCNALSSLAGYYIQAYLSELIYTLEHGKFKYNRLSLKPNFYQFIGALCILNQLNAFLDPNEFASLKTIILQDIELSTLHIEYLLSILNNIEIIHLRNCFIHDSTFEQLANHCPKLKYLNVDQCYMLVGGVSNTIFSRHYPTLEHLKFLDDLEDVDRPIGKLKIFLEKHSNLNHLECGNRFLWTNRALLIETNIQLDLLTIHFEQLFEMNRFVYFLRKLFRRNFYKTLHLSFGDVNVSSDLQNFGNTIFTVPAIKHLSINANLTHHLSNLTKLHELHLKRLYRFNQGWADLELMAKSLMDLIILNIDDANFDDILPFIRYSKKLHTIRIHRRFLHEEIFDLFALNEVRKNVAGACRISICVHQKTYLPTVWNPKNLHLSHIKIMRTDFGGFDSSNQDILNLLLHRFIDRTRRGEPDV